MQQKKDVVEKITELFDNLVDHDGYGGLTVDVRILKKNQKEVVINCGKQYRYVINWQ